MKRYLFKYQISLPTCFCYCSTELQFLTVVGMLSRDALPVDIGAKYFDGSSCLLQKAPAETHHIHQFEKVYGMRTIITIINADYCFMSQLLLNILSNVTLLPTLAFLYILNIPYQNFPFFHNCHTTPKGHGLPPPPPPLILNVHLMQENHG